MCSYVRLRSQDVSAMAREARDVIRKAREDSLNAFLRGRLMVEKSSILRYLGWKPKLTFDQVAQEYEDRWQRRALGADDMAGYYKASHAHQDDWEKANRLLLMSSLVAADSMTWISDEDFCMMVYWRDEK